MTTMDAETRFRTTGRNDDCPCGSGKKYKKCHLREDEEAVSSQLAAKNAEAAKAAEAEEEAGHEGHNHPPGMHPKAGAGAKSFASPKTPMVNKPVTTPRKAV